MTSASNLIDIASVAKSKLDSDNLSVTVSNYHTDLLTLESIIYNDLNHNARSIPHKDFILKNQSDTGLFRVHSFRNSDSTFLYFI